MSKLRDLVSLMSVTLGDPEKSVHVHAMHLRKAKLLSSTGRGLHSARMGASDATNLLLACIHAGKAKDSAAVVARLREAPIHAWARIGGLTGALEELGLPTAAALRKLPERHTLGAALDALFEEWSSQGHVTNQPTGDPFSSIHLDLTTTATGWTAHLRFRPRDVDWEVSYHQCRPELDDVPVARGGKSQKASERSTRGHKEITVRVPNDSLEAIASCIGYEREGVESRMGAGT